MKRLSALLISIMLLMAGIAYAKDYEVTKKSSAYVVVFKNDKNPPATGENNFAILVKDASGKNVTDAKVKVEYSMPAMPGMPAMNYKTNAVLKGNEFTGKMNLSMAGSWNIAIKITKAEKTETVKVTMDAH